MPDYFNDTLDNIKDSLQEAENNLSALHVPYTTLLYNRTAAMTAVFQTEVLLVIADSLTRIADAMEAADDRDGLAESVAIWGTDQ